VTFHERASYTFILALSLTSSPRADAWMTPAAVQVAWDLHSSLKSRPLTVPVFSFPAEAIVLRPTKEDNT
jgi:hypothetical protein